MFKGVMLGCILGLTVFTSAGAAVIYVPDDYPAIQGAIDAAVNGDTIIVKPGTYVENVDFIGKAVTLMSERGPEVTTIDGKTPTKSDYTSVVIFKSGELPDSVLDGFTLTNGKGSLGHGGYLHGGGIFCEYSSPTILNCIIVANKTGSRGRGGGMYNYCCDDLTVKGCLFTGNEADYRGGGIANDQTRLTLVNCVITDNTARHIGGGIYSFLSTLTVAGCTLSRNACVLGGGMCNYATGAFLSNCILWNDSPDEIYLYSTGTAEVIHSCIQGGWTGTGNIDADPLFADPAGGDYHLTWDSPCRDSGDNGTAAEPVDFEGDPRIAHGTADMGADEFHTHLYCMGAVIPGSSVDIKVVGDPGMTPVKLALGSGVQDPPQPTPYGDLYLTLPPVKTFNLGAVPASGVLVVPAVVPSKWQSGESYPFQALVGPLAAGSELTNLMTLDVE